MKADLDDPFNNPTPVPKVKPSRVDILASLRWRKQKEVETSKGPRLKQEATVKHECVLRLFAEEGADLRRLGYVLAEWPQESGHWTVTKWDLLPAKIIIERQQASEMSRATDHTIDIPRPEGMEFFGFQKAGVAFILTRRNTLLADEPGLGKTCQAIGVINCTPEAKKILVICPASLKLNWRAELQKWLVKRYTIFVADGKVCPELACGITIINYDVLKKHDAVIKGTEWDILVADEAHYLKNPKSGRSIMVLGARATREERANGMADIPGITAARKILMTGTPICNRPKELFPLISYLDEITWSKKWEYLTRYCGACQDNGWNSDGASHLDELQQKLRSTIMIRRLKKDVMKELPPKLRRVVEFSPTGHMLEVAKEERAQYNSEAEYKAAIENMISHPTSAGDRPTYRKNCAIAKAQMKEVLAYLDEAIEESGKVIIFVWHREVYHLLRQHFGHKAVGMNGETPMAQRHAAVEAFQNDISIGAIVGQMITMGTGLTLTASSRVIFMELDDVPGNVSQAEDRAHRIGQEDNVLVEHLIVTGTIDAAMAKNCVYKQDIIDKALDHQKNPKAAAPLPASPVIQATPQPKQPSLL